MGFSACLTLSQVSGNVPREGGGPSGAEKMRKKMEKKKKQNCWLNSKVESALEVENPEKKTTTKTHLLATIVPLLPAGQISNSSALQPRSFISRCQPLFPAFLPNFLNFSPYLHPLITLVIHLASLH